MMNTTQILDALQCVKQFGGVIPADKLPDKPKHKFYIINTDPSYLPGKHWVAVYMCKVPEFFDSLGHAPTYYNKEFENFLINHGPNYVYNSQRLQNYGSDICGLYCIYYVLKRSSGISLKKLVQNFNNLDYNDIKVREYFRRLN